MSYPTACAPADDTECSAAPVTEHDQAEHQLCERWARWVETRRFYAPPPSLGVNLLAKLQRRPGTVATPGGPDAECSPELMALHQAITAQPMDETRQAFEAFYRLRLRNIKRAAQAMGISRSTFYDRIRRFRHRAISAKAAIQRDQQAVKPKDVH